MSGIMLNYMATSVTTTTNTSSTAVATLYGSATIATGTSPFSGGGNSYEVFATASPYSYVTVPNGNFNFGTGPFTMEWFSNQVTGESYPRRLWLGTGPTWGFDIEGTTPYFWVGSSPSAFSAVTESNSTWYHYALVRSGTTLSFYRNGALVSSVTNSTSFTDTTSLLYIGGKPSGLTSEQFAGYMTSIRICNIAVYTGAFTVPTSKLGKVEPANPYGGSNTAAIASGQCLLLLNP